MWFYLPGGAYARGLATGWAALVADSIGRTSMRGVSIQYQFTTPEHPFPAAVEVSVAAYRGLLASRIFALLIQARFHEILLDDALRVAARATEADVAVTLEVTFGVPHLFQAFTSALHEGAAALESVATFCAHSSDRRWNPAVQ